MLAKAILAMQYQECVYAMVATSKIHMQAQVTVIVLA
jgi:hypothetical protein